MWTVNVTFDVDPDIDTLDQWAEGLGALDGSVARVPDRGVVVVTVHLGEDLRSPIDAATIAGDIVTKVAGAAPVGIEAITDEEQERRASTPTLPEMVGATEVGEILGVSRQRVHQLRTTAAFPAPLFELRTGPVWDAIPIRKFAHEWTRKPGRPAKAG